MSDFAELALQVEEGLKKLKAMVETKEQKILYVSVAIKFYRIRNHMSMEQLAAYLGVSKMSVMRWEKGVYCPHNYVFKHLEERGVV